MDIVQVLSHGDPGSHTSKRMQLDPYLSIHKHSMTVTLNSLVYIDDLWTGGRLFHMLAYLNLSQNALLHTTWGFHEV